MADHAEQNFANHAKFVPLYHFVAFGLLVINFGWSLWRVWQGVTGDAIVAVLLSVALILLFFFARLFALAVQDRVIRLEMRLRMRDLFPADLQSRIKEFTTPQLIALRFASDEELVALSRRVLDEKINDRTAIKKLVTHWVADNQRA